MPPRPEPKRVALVIVVDALVEDYGLADLAAKRLAQRIRHTALDATGTVRTGEALATVARTDAATFVFSMNALGTLALAEANRVPGDSPAGLPTDSPPIDSEEAPR